MRFDWPYYLDVAQELADQAAGAPPSCKRRSIAQRLAGHITLLSVEHVTISAASRGSVNLHMETSISM